MSTRTVTVLTHSILYDFERTTKRPSISDPRVGHLLILNINSDDISVLSQSFDLDADTAETEIKRFWTSKTNAEIGWFGLQKWNCVSPCRQSAEDVLYGYTGNEQLRRTNIIQTFVQNRVTSWRRDEVSLRRRLVAAFIEQEIAHRTILMLKRSKLLLRRTGGRNCK